MIYRSMVASRLRAAFAALNRGNTAPILASFGPNAEHVFFGTHALAGARRSPATIRAWYARLRSIFPDLHFDLSSIVVQGPPWNTVAMVEWQDRFTLRDGERLGNQGVHTMRLAWGKVSSLHVHCDTQKLAVVLERLRSQGVLEAGSPPISDETENQDQQR